VPRRQTLVERWDGSVWRIQPTPNPGGALGAGLSAVSCRSSATCVAVGGDVAEIWNGRTWRISSARQRDGTVSALAAVACTAACTAVGGSTRTLPSASVLAGFNGVGVPLAEDLSAGNWTLDRTVVAEGPGASELDGVRCATGRFCIAVGADLSPATGRLVAFAERWNGDRWTIQRVPQPSGTRSSALAAVSCSSGRACLAVGSYTSGAGVTSALAESWNGMSWKLVDAKGGGLSGVSCTSPIACIAVGGSQSEVWNGHAWMLDSVPAGPSALLNGISCVSATACTAVGSTGTSPLAARWDGSAWTIQNAPSDPSVQASLQAVSCISATACEAVGYAPSSQPDWATAGWSGGGWTLQSSPAGDGIVDRLNGVSCTSATFCTAVGLTAGPLEYVAPQAEVWDGTSWRLEDSGMPAQATINAVSCISASVCTAVGSTEHMWERQLILRSSN
jgi:hypothetical protein